ncbi:LuxR C-terminal-related transcriptional regulator [Streptomyces sp. NPDC059373]
MDGLRDIAGHVQGEQPGQEALAIYRFAVGRPAFGPDDLSELRLPPGTAEKALCDLVAMRLLSRVGEDPEAYTAIAPRIAAGRMLSPMERQIREKQEEIERLRLTFEALVPAYEAQAQAHERSRAVELITDLPTVLETIEELAHSCTSEALTSQPGGARRPEVLQEAIERDERMLARGVLMRTIYQHPARYSQPTIAYVQRMTELGAQVRTQTDGLIRMLIFDRRIGVISVKDNPHAALLVREPNIVDFMIASFNHAWRNADPFPVGFDRGATKRISDEVKQSIVALLAEGLEDKAIARRLGMSERSCQRHVAQIMNAIGARSRFQTGFLLGRQQPAGESDGEADGNGEEPGPSVTVLEAAEDRALPGA